MADRESSFVVSFEGTGSSLQAFLSALKKDFRTTVADMQSSSDALQLFRTVQAQAQKAAQAFFDTKKRVDELKVAITAIEGAGGTVGKDLAKQMRDAEKAFAAATKELDKQKASLKDARANMDATSAATAKLAAEQKKLGEEWRRQVAASTAAQEAASKAAQAAVRLAQEVRGVGQAFQANKDFLGFKQVRDIQPELDKARAAFAQLASSGKLSFSELGLAQNALNAKLREINASVGTLGSSFTAVRTQLLAFTAATAGIVALASNSAKSFRDFAQQLAAVGTISGATGAQLEAIGQRVRDLAQAMGKDAVDATKALYEIIGSGFDDPNQALIILEQSMRAAVAGMTDTAITAKVVVTALNTFGLQATDASRVFDILFQTVDRGQVLFHELAANLGEVGPSAVAAGLSLEIVGGMFAVLTKNGRSAAEAATQIRGSIESLNPQSAELRKAFGELNISLGDTVSTLEQLSKLPQDVLPRLIPDDRARRGIQTFTQNFTLLRGEIERMVNSAGKMQEFYNKMAATPQAKVDRFNASVRELNLTIGEFVTKAAPAVEVLTDLINGFNNLGPATKSLVVQIAGLGVGLLAVGAAFALFRGPINAVVGLFGRLSLAAAGVGGAATAAGAALLGLQVGAVALAAFKFGEILHEQFEFVRKDGELIAIASGRIENSLGLAQSKIRAFFSGNIELAKRAEQTYRSNAEILDGMYSDAVSGASEKTRQLAAEHERLGAAFVKARDSTISAASTAQAAVSVLLSAIKAQVTITDNAINAARTRLGQFSDSLREQSALIAKTAQENITTLVASTQAQIAALGTVHQSEVERTKATTEIQKQSNAERLELLTKFATDVKAAYETEAAARLAIAGKNKLDIERVERELTVIRKGSLTEVVNAFRAHIAELVQIQSGHVASIQNLEERRKESSLTIERAIREIRSGSLTAYEQDAEKVKEIDRLISLARAALVAGDAKKAEEYATKVIGLASGIANQVTSDGRVVVGQYEAMGRAVGKLKIAEDLLTQSFDAQKGAAAAGANEAAEAHKRAKEELGNYETELDRVRAKAEQDIQSKITLDLAGIDKELVALQALVTQKELLAPLQLGLEDANKTLEGLKAELAANGIPANLKVNLEEINKAVKAVNDAKPELTVNVKKATDAVGEVAKAAKDLESLHPTLTIETNAKALKKEIDETLTPDTKSEHIIEAPTVDDVQSAIDNLKLDTSSTHTQYIRQIVVEQKSAGGPVGAAAESPPLPPIPGFARGGAVGRFARGGPAFRIRSTWKKLDEDEATQPRTGRESVHKLARGGPLFRIPAWNKVPGVGDDDTVPAALRRGSYVIRKSASKHYGDKIMSALALGRMPVKRFAIGGRVTNPLGLEEPPKPKTRPDGTTIFYKSDGTEESPFFGDVSARKVESQRSFQADIFGEPDLPKDARKLERLIIGYSDAVIVAARQIDGSMYWAPAIRALGIDRKDYEQQPTAEKLAVILRRARGIGLNIGITGSVRRGFDVDGRRFHKKAARAPAGLANARLYSYDFYARGGGLRDTVRALLTPGEQVMRPAAVQKYGTKFMADINNMRFPKGALTGMLTGMFAPPRIQQPRIQHFAEGGLVGDTAAGRRILGGDSETGRRLLAGEVSEIGKRLLALESEPRVMNRTINATFNLMDPNVNEDWVRREIIPVLDRIAKSKG